MGGGYSKQWIDMQFAYEIKEPNPSISEEKKNNKTEQKISIFILLNVVKHLYSP